MGSKKKSRKEFIIGDQDRISYLPDDVMSRILSSIPTVDAVATCILSRYWQYKWTCIYNIEVDDRKRYQLGASAEAMFVKFLNNIVDRTENVRRVRLKLIYEYDTKVVYSWLSALLKNKLEILYIDTQQEDLVIPGSVLSTTLRALAFGSGIFKVSDSNCFRNLKNLFLEKVNILNETGSGTLSFTFPVLEVLKLLKCKWSLVKFVEISAPSMNTFVSETVLHVPFDHYKINIQGGKITNFTAKGGEPENFSVVGSKVTYAALQNIIDENDRSLERSGVKLRNLLKQFSSALEELTLSLYVTQALLLPEELFYLPRFDKLQRLVLCSSECFTYGNTDALLEFLIATPFLKYLVIDVLRWEEYDYDSVEPPIPSCIASSLEEIELRNITAIESAFQLAKFLLKTAVNLKKFHVTSLYEKVKVEVAKDIASAYPDVSICVTVVGH